MFNIIQNIVIILVYLTFQHYFISPSNFKSTSMPCCLETIGKKSCEEMLRTKPYAFEEKCENDPDFAIIQCCHTCQTNVQVLLFLYFKQKNIIIIEIWFKSF